MLSATNMVKPMLVNHFYLYLGPIYP